ncbi:hypothetical protein [Paenibacillus polymyxa]|uniref:hypothetical protein n=2 Tax=Paenibacillus polymyxa TaxID=1406 RepID=UPI0013924833|nr:hypothetical protein [Paenibacillus polymyxa]
MKYMCFQFENQNPKYLAEHGADLADYRAAQDTFRRLLSGKKLPKINALKAEYRELGLVKALPNKQRSKC